MWDLGDGVGMSVLNLSFDAQGLERKVCGIVDNGGTLERCCGRDAVLADNVSSL